MNFGRRTFLTGAAAAIASSPARAAQDAPATVTVGLPPGYMGAIVDYAQERGYFKGVGLETSGSVLNSGAAIAAAVTGGALEIGAVNVGSLASAYVRGVPLRILAPASVVPPGPYGDVVMVRKDSPLRGGADFNGKTVAIVALKTVQHAAFLAWLESRGGDPSAVKMIEMPLPEMTRALDAGRVDAAIPVEPFTTIGRPGHRILGTVYDAMPRPFLIFAMCATQGWLQANPATAAKFAVALRRAALWANGHEQECRSLLASVMKLDPQVANTMLMPTSGTRLDATSILPVIDVMVKYGFLDKAVAPGDMIWQYKA